jgi:hypothetical protein
MSVLLQAGVNVSEQLQLPLALLGSLPIGMCLESLGLPQYNAARHVPHQSFGGEALTARAIVILECNFCMHVLSAAQLPHEDANSRLEQALDAPQADSVSLVPWLHVTCCCMQARCFPPR